MGEFMSEWIYITADDLNLNNYWYVEVLGNSGVTKNEHKYKTNNGKIDNKSQV